MCFESINANTRLELSDFCFELRNAAKVLIAGGALYVTTAKGVWECGTEKANEVLLDIKKNILPDSYLYMEKVFVLPRLCAFFCKPRD